MQLDYGQDHESANYGSMLQYATQLVGALYVVAADQKAT
jgi:hypothetical protein